MSIAGCHKLLIGVSDLVPDATQLGHLRTRMSGRLLAKLLSTDPAMKLVTKAIAGNR